MKRKMFLSLWILAGIVFSVSCGSRFQYRQIVKGTDQKSIEQELGRKPDSEKKEAGMTLLQYNDCPCLDYNGTAVYCLAEDALTYSKWEYPAKSSQDANGVYQAIKADLQKQYGDGEETGDDGSFLVSSWHINTESTVSLTCTSAGQQFTVSVLSTITEASPPAS